LFVAFSFSPFFVGVVGGVVVVVVVDFFFGGGRRKRNFGKNYCILLDFS